MQCSLHNLGSQNMLPKPHKNFKTGQLLHVRCGINVKQNIAVKLWQFLCISHRQGTREPQFKESGFRDYEQMGVTCQYEGRGASYVLLWNFSGSDRSPFC